MKTPLRLPKEQIAALRPGDVRLYLTSRGWVAEPDGPHPKALTFHDSARRDAEVLLPMDRSLGDYLLRMADVVVALAHLENRSVWEVLNDLSMPPGDVFRLSVVGSVATLGNLPLDEAIRLIRGSRQLLWSSAFSLIRPQAVHPLRSVKKVNDFLGSCRLGQTERGSFVATIIAPVPPEIQPGLHFPEDEHQPEDEPFERQVTTRLMSSLGLVSDAIRMGETNRILDGVSQGISANFCEALGLMKPPGDESRLDVKVSWARTRPHLPADIPTAVSFPQEDFAIIEEAGRQLVTRSFARRERYEGKPIKVEKALQTFFDEVVGRLLFATQVSGAPAHVRFDLDQEEWSLACDALRDGRRVAVSGVIRRDAKGRDYELSEPSDFQVLNDA